MSNTITLRIGTPVPQLGEQFMDGNLEVTVCAPRAQLDISVRGHIKDSVVGSGQAVMSNAPIGFQEHERAFVVRRWLSLSTEDNNTIWLGCPNSAYQITRDEAMRLATALILAAREYQVEPL